MADNKYQDNKFSYSLKQEAYETFNWGNLGEDTEDLRNQPYFPRFNRNNQQDNYNSLTLNNPGLDNDTLSLYRPNLNPNLVNELGEQSIRNNSTFSGFDDNILSRTNNNMDINPNTLNKFQNALDVVPNFRSMQPIQNPLNYFSIGNSVRRPLPPDFLEEEPIYVNPKQYKFLLYFKIARYERIMKLRIKKAKKGIIKNPAVIQDKNKDGYKHESRHLHAKRRERGTGGRFLSKAEIEKKKLEDTKGSTSKGDQIDNFDNKDPNTQPQTDNPNEN